MSEKSAADVFDEQLKKTICQFQDDSSRHKSKALRLKLSTTALSAAATVLLGWQGASEGLAMALKNVALLLTASITVLAAYDAFFEPRRLWVRERVVLNSARDLQRDWEIAKVASAPGVDVGSYGRRLTRILEDSLKDWAAAKKNE